VPSLAISAPASATVEGCLASAVLAGGVATSALDPPSLSPLSGAALPGGAVLYYQDPSGAVGVAREDPGDGRFRPGPSILWTSDRPPYGMAVVALPGDGGDVEVEALGCRGARFLDADCFLAEAPGASVADESAYGYYAGGGRFSPRVDDAWPMTTGAASLDVQWVEEQARWVMVYVGPLGSTLTVRSGVTPHGPWSAPIELATCDLVDADMFCAGVHLHPSLATAPGTVVVSYAAASLSPGVGARKLAEADKWWPRLATLALPALP
jgi:hypothetical protein